MKTKQIIPVLLVASVMIVGTSGLVSAIYQEDKIDALVFATLDGDGYVIDTWTVEEDPDGAVFTTTTEWEMFRMDTLRVHVSKDHMSDPTDTEEAEDLVSSQISIDFYDEADELLASVDRTQNEAYHVSEEEDYHVVDVATVIVDVTDGHPVMDYGYYADISIEYRIVS